MKTGRHPHDDVFRRAVLALEAAEKGPTAEVLAESPLLVNWQVILRAGRLCLAGEVSGHPDLKEGFITTSHLVFLSPGLEWARTMSEFYRLGPSLGLMPTDTDAFKSSNLVLLEAYGWPSVTIHEARKKLHRLAECLRAEGAQAATP